jgi:hypothetical protein
MKPQHFSLPPNDAELTERVVVDALAQLPEGSPASLAELMPPIVRQLPCGVARDAAIAVLVRQASLDGRAVLFDGRGV